MDPGLAVFAGGICAAAVARLRAGGQTAARWQRALRNAAPPEGWRWELPSRRQLRADLVAAKRLPSGAPRLAVAWNGELPREMDPWPPVSVAAVVRPEVSVRSDAADRAAAWLAEHGWALIDARRGTDCVGLTLWVRGDHGEVRLSEATPRVEGLRRVAALLTAVDRWAAGS